MSPKNIFFRFVPLFCGFAIITYSQGLWAQAFNFGTVGALNTNAGSDTGLDLIPQITTDGAGNWVAIWESLDTLGGTIGPDSDTLVARSSDNGGSWTPPAALNTNATTDSGSDRLAQIETDGTGIWIAVWYGNDTLGSTIGGDNDILFARSTNAGASWSAVAALNTNAATDSGDDLHPQIATDGGDNWVVVWQSTDTLSSTVGGDIDILVSTSSDDGVNWSAPAALNSNATTDTGDDQWPFVATDGGGNWITAWESFDDLGATIGTDRDLLVSTSSNNGGTWTALATLNSGAATDSGEDVLPRIATDGSGNWVTIWYSNDSLGATVGTDFDLFVSRSVDNGGSWTTSAALNTNAATDGSDGDSTPYLVYDATDGFFVTWHSGNTLGGTIGTDADIIASLSSDGGVTWSAPDTIDSKADTDSGSDLSAIPATDGSGNWVVIWYSLDSVGGTTGSDGDILVTTSSGVPVELSEIILE